MAEETKRKPTAKQKKALDIMVENGGNVSKAMRQAGYSAETAKTPSKLTDSQGFTKLMEERGLTDTLLVDALVEDIKNKTGNRVAELTLAAKLRGREKNSLDITTGGEPLTALVEFVSGNDKDTAS